MSGPLELTSEEVIALYMTLNLPSPGFIASEAIDAWSAEIRNSVVLIGLRSLAARDLFRRTQSEAKIPEILTELMTTVCRPSLAARAQVVSTNSRSLTVFLATPVRTVAHRLTGIGNHVFTMFGSERLLEAMLAACDLPASIPSGILGRQKGIEGVGVDLAARLSSPDSTVMEIAVAYPQSESILMGGSVTWLTEVNGSSFLIEKAEGEDSVEGTPIDKSELPALVRGLLPGKGIAGQEDG